LNPQEAKLLAAATDPDHIRRSLSEGFDFLFRTTGLICTSATATSIPMWSHYADSHRGLCIGYRTDIRPFQLAMSVIYQNPSGPVDVVDILVRDFTELADQISRRKAACWAYEQEIEFQ